MAYRNRTAVVGCVLQPSISAPNKSLEELLYDAAGSALADAGLTIEDIDGIVVAANDQYDGRAIAVMAASGSVGGVDRDILSTPSAGEHAFVLGALRVASGEFQTQLVMSWSPLEVSSLSEAQRLAADPYFHRRLPLDELSAHALQASALASGVPDLDALAMSIIAKNRNNGARAYPALAKQATEAAEVQASRPLRWPIREAAVAPPAAGVAAMVLASADFVAARDLKQVAWLDGMGWATEPALLGDRDLARLPGFAAATARAYDEAGIKEPLAEFGVAEVADATAYQELLAYEYLGLCPRDRWRERVEGGVFGAKGELPVNLSGGALTANPVFCTGLMRIGEVANQLRGRAGPHQAEQCSRGVAHAASGMAMQYNTVVVMSQQNSGERP